MPLKNKIEPDHIPLNKYALTIVGIGEVVFTTVSGLETEVAAIDLPDRTKATGGQISSAELTVTVPMHHSASIAIMNLWHQEAQDPVTITYKKGGVLRHISGTGDISRTYMLVGAWCSKQKLPDLSFEDDGGMAEVEFTIQVDTVQQIT